MLPVKNLIFRHDLWQLNGKFKITEVVEMRTKKIGKSPKSTK